LPSKFWQNLIRCSKVLAQPLRREVLRREWRANRRASPGPTLSSSRSTRPSATETCSWLRIAKLDWLMLLMLPGHAMRRSSSCYQQAGRSALFFVAQCFDPMILGPGARHGGYLDTSWVRRAPEYPHWPLDIGHSACTGINFYVLCVTLSKQISFSRS
jgi:hypothetical protein